RDPRRLQGEHQPRADEERHLRPEHDQPRPDRRLGEGAGGPGAPHQRAHRQQRLHRDPQRPDLDPSRLVGGHRHGALLHAQGNPGRRRRVLVPYRRPGPGGERPDHRAPHRAQPGARPLVPELHAGPVERADQHQLQRVHAAAQRGHPAAPGERAAAAAEPDVDRRPSVVLPARRHGTAAARDRARPVGPGLAPGQARVGGPGVSAQPRTSRLRRPREPHRLFWAALAAPGIIWLALLFIVPFYAILAIAGGYLDLFGVPVPVWNPLHWSTANFSKAWHDVAGSSAFVGPTILRTLVYVALASLISLLIAYPAAYFVARFAGRRKALFLILLIAPFWISYMMRMLAWIDLLQTNGYVNKTLSLLHLIGQPVNWLGGLGFTVVLGLVYGYIPYLILVLYAGLDRIDPALIEAGRDLGLGRVRTFVHITLPLSRQAIL